MKMFNAFRRIGFYGVFSMAGTLYTTALLYGIFVLKEVPPKEKTEQIINKSFLADFFDFSHIKETFLVAFKARVRNRRMKILALMAVVVIVVGPQNGNFHNIYFNTLNNLSNYIPTYATLSFLVLIIVNIL